MILSLFLSLHIGIRPHLMEMKPGMLISATDDSYQLFESKKLTRKDILRMSVRIEEHEK